jgi:uncharacterized membrane protein YhaH (DUF805 family)
MDILQLMFSFRGRINRKMFWLATIVFAIGFAIADLMTESAEDSTVGIGLVIMLALIWPSLAVQTKRWHDRDKSGWWNLIGFVPLIGPAWALIELGFLAGTTEENCYGFPPDAPAGYANTDIPRRTVNPYLENPYKESETLVGGSNISNAWRGR